MTLDKTDNVNCDSNEQETTTIVPLGYGYIQT